jgi:hypothetical protein
MGTPFKMKGSPMKRNFNFTGDSKSTTPGYSTTKQAKKSTSIIQSLVKPGAKDPATAIGSKNTLKSELSKGTKRFVESAKGKWKGFKAPKISSKIVKFATEAGKVARFAGKATGVGFVGEGLYQAYKSGQKHSGGKVNKNQKSIWDNKKQIVKR